MAPANQTKERSVHELFAGAFRNKKFNVNRACFPKEKHQNSQKWAKFMNFSFWPFLWFGLPGRLLRKVVLRSSAGFVGYEDQLATSFDRRSTIDTEIKAKRSNIISELNAFRIAKAKAKVEFGVRYLCGPECEISSVSSNINTKAKALKQFRGIKFTLLSVPTVPKQVGKTVAISKSAIGSLESEQVGYRVQRCNSCRVLTSFRNTPAHRYNYSTEACNERAQGR